MKTIPTVTLAVILSAGAAYGAGPKGGGWSVTKKAEAACRDVGALQAAERSKNVRPDVDRRVEVRNPDGVKAMDGDGGKKLKTFRFGDECLLNGEARLDEMRRDGDTVLLKVSSAQDFTSMFQPTCPVGTLILLQAERWEAMVRLNAEKVRQERQHACIEDWIRRYTIGLLGESDPR